MKHVFFIFIAFAGLFSCNNHRSANEQVLKDFDSVSKSLEKTNDKASKSTIVLYAELERKITTSDNVMKIKDLQYSVQDFYAFISDLKKRFIIACGDNSGAAIPLHSGGNRAITNNFFFQNENETKSLFPQLKSIQFSLRVNASGSSLRNQINSWNTFKFTEGPGGNEGNKFMKKYFYNLPPVAAITILNKFENDIKIFENKVLSNYLKL